MYYLRYCICCTLFVNKVVYKCLSIPSLFTLQKPIYPQNFMLIIALFFELKEFNLKKKKLRTVLIIWQYTSILGNDV